MDAAVSTHHNASLLYGRLTLAAGTVLLDIVLSWPVAIAFHLKLCGNVFDNYGSELFPLGCQHASMEVSRRGTYEPQLNAHAHPEQTFRKPCYVLRWPVLSGPQTQLYGCICSDGYCGRCANGEVKS